VGLDRKPWTSSVSAGGFCRERSNKSAYRIAIRTALGTRWSLWAKDRCKTWAATQAWAQNPGHESPTITFGSYGKVATHDQGELVRNAGKRTQDTPDGKLNEIKSMIGAAATASRLDGKLGRFRVRFVSGPRSKAAPCHLRTGIPSS
jgi:hypothetical protein